MECDRWIEEGLLLSSDELEENRKAAFENHLATCEKCRTEFERYQEEKQLYFTPQNLEYSTTPSLDERIREACGKTPIPTSSLSLFTTFIRRVAVAGLFLTVGIGGSFYFAYNIQEARQLRSGTALTHDSTANARGTAETAALLASQEPNARDGEPSDTALADSAGKSPATIIKRGGAGTTGVVPVDLSDD
ncbi:MAG: hypothetical protein GF344_14045 [Chitinivibrionales bacterium]|nr:hypothetical protein [Chitinivibrionales bacterium]MBD3357847.1 hypothetical protein [Chitinivibrionales bacterium]